MLLLGGPRERFIGFWRKLVEVMFSLESIRAVRIVEKFCLMLDSIAMARSWNAACENIGVVSGR